MNFWKQLKRPFFILAPMADVTDMAFRQIIVECGKPDVLYTEFVSAAGLCSSRFLPNWKNLVEKSRILDFATPTRSEAKSGEKGFQKFISHLKFKENERPIVAQIFGSVSKHFYECAKLVAELGFDGIDINMGCPASKIMKQNSGAGLILNPELAKEIIRETKRGIADAGSSIPVSIKTRIGYNSIITEEWISKIIEAQPDAIIVHGRTMKEASKIPTHWDEISKAGKLCREAGIPIIGNGDVMSYAEGVEKAKQYNLDGIMVGRGIFNNPWFFNPTINPADKTPTERVLLLKKHIENFNELWGTDKNFAVMKRFIKIYINDSTGAKDFRGELMETKSASETLELLDMFLN